MKAILFCLACTISSFSFAETLTVFIWDDYLSKEVIHSWEKDTGHTLKQIYFDNDKDRDSVIAGKQTKSIDLVLLDQYAAIHLGQEGYLEPRPSVAKVPNIERIDSHWKSSCGEHGIPYLWGTLGVAYRADKVSPPPTSWNDLLTPKDALVGHIGMFEDYTDLLAPALFLDQHPVNTNDKAALKAAFERLKTTMPKLLMMEYPITFMNSSNQADQLYMTMAYSGDQFTLNDISGSNQWQYTILKEGTVTWIDCLAVLKDSQHKDIALDFLEHLYDINNAAINSESLYVATPISAATALQSTEFQADPTVYPNASLIKESDQYRQIGLKNIELRNRITSALVKTYDSK